MFTKTFLVNLLKKCLIIFQVLLNPKKEYWKHDVRFIINEESDYSQENASDNEDFLHHSSTISVWLSLKWKKRVVMQARNQEIFRTGQFSWN